MSDGRGLHLDRMAVEDAGPNPERIAAAIHDQLTLPHGPTPIFEIARALDIVEIRETPLKSFEAALLALPERDMGAILVNASSSEQRRRFSVAHELCHFLNVWHRPIHTPDGGGFACRKEDMGAWEARSLEAPRHALQEAQANRFAIELLAPRKFFKRFLRGIPDLDAVLQLSPLLNVSREAVARRYVELHDIPAAVVFSREGLVRYADRHRDFPPLACRPRSPSPALPDPPHMPRPAGAIGWLVAPRVTSSSKPCTSRTASPLPCFPSKAPGATPTRLERAGAPALKTTSLAAA